MRSILFIILFGLISLPGRGQEKQSPYKTEFWKDAAWITGAVGLNALGVYSIQNKPELSETEIANLSKKDLWKINRGAAGNYSENADKLSYIPFYGSFATPILFLLGENERANYGQISVLFIETMATTGALFTLTAGNVEKSRPLVYNEDLPIEDRMDSDAQRSFFAGHTAATAAATFFTAKVFSDYHPDSPAVPYVWAGAIAIPAYVGYLRTEAGKHFFTDNLIGFGIGAFCGILVPEVHKKTNDKIDVYPTMSTNVLGTGLDAKGIGVTYAF